MNEQGGLSRKVCRLLLQTSIVALQPSFKLCGGGVEGEEGLPLTVFRQYGGGVKGGRVAAWGVEGRGGGADKTKQ